MLLKFFLSICDALHQMHAYFYISAAVLIYSKFLSIILLLDEFVVGDFIDKRKMPLVSYIEN